MEKFDEMFEQATSKIEAGYFQLPIFGGDAVYRERVYCYELYHQLRCEWPDTPYSLNGEINKQGHRHLAELGIHGGIPDLLIHRIGEWDNFAIIEVKPAGATEEAIRVDLDKLCRFIQIAEYRRAIYLVYGHGVGDETIERVAGIYAGIENKAQVEIWLHVAPKQPAVRHTVLEV